MTRIYLAGPISGRPDYSVRFGAAATELTANGYTPVDPTEPGEVDGWQWSDYMRRALTMLLTADGIALIPGWRRSRGARLERHLARALGMPAQPLAVWIHPQTAPPAHRAYSAGPGPAQDAGSGRGTQQRKAPASRHAEAVTTEEADFRDQN